MANNLVQNTIYQLSDALNCPLGVIDEGSAVISYDDCRDVQNNFSQIVYMASDTDSFFTFSGYTFYCPSSTPNIDYIYFSKGEDENAAKNVQILSISLGSIKKMHDEKFDKLNFMKNVILDNILTGDLIIKSKELRIQYDSERVVFLIKTTNTSDFSAVDVLMNLYPDRNHDFIINIDANTIVVIKDLDAEKTGLTTEEIAQQILSTLNSESLIQAVIGIGTVAQNINSLAKSYKDACMALEIGKVSDLDKNIVNYDNLGIARLIYHLPTTLCELFLDEVFKKESIDVLDQETIYTIQKFFENNLNVSETSRHLYVHRNTLVYRLDKVQKLTGLDLRVFDHAIVFKVALMVKRYLQSNNSKI